MSLPLTVSRLSAAELLAYTVRDMFPTVLLHGAEVTDLGFYYDFFFDQPINEEIFPFIEERMRFLIKRAIPISTLEMMRENAIAFFRHLTQPYLAESLKTIPDLLVQICQIEEFYDLCSLPGVKNTQQIGFIKLIKLEEIPNQRNGVRIHGVVFSDKAQLKAFFKRAEVAKKRDHCQLGQEMALFSFQKESCPGSITWLPKGMILKELLLSWWKQEHCKQHFQFLSTPKLIHSSFFNQFVPSALKKVFPSVKIDDQEYLLNPHHDWFHALVFNSTPHTYRDLPIRYAESIDCYSNEKKGTLHGLLRSRTFSADTAQIFCSPSQLRDELISSLHFIHQSVNMLGFRHRWFLCLRGQKFAGTLNQWNETVDLMTEALSECGLEYQLDKESHPFYGPCVEIRFVDAIGVEWKGPYLGVNFYLPNCFALQYQSQDDRIRAPIMITRSMFGSLERVIAILIEHTAGLLPFWLAPEQLRVIPVSEKNMAYAWKVLNVIENSKLRASIDHLQENLSAKIHAAKREKIPYLIVLGDKEENKNDITVRSCDQDTIKSGVKLESFLDELKQDQSQWLINI